MKLPFELSLRGFVLVRTEISEDLQKEAKIQCTQ